MKKALGWFLILLPFAALAVGCVATIGWTGFGVVFGFMTAVAGLTGAGVWLINGGRK